MPTFVAGDHVKVVRESETNPEYNFGLRLRIGKSGTVADPATSDHIYRVVIKPYGKDPFFIPADMLELEATMHEDELPDDMTDAEYSDWFEKSYIPGGVGCRVGPMFVRKLEADNG